MDKIIPYSVLFLVCVIAVIVYYRWVEPPQSGNRIEKEAEVILYMSNETPYWRWYCSYDHVGMYDFKTYEDAVKSLRIMGYWSR
jgi:hypothetical protein